MKEEILKKTTKEYYDVAISLDNKPNSSIILLFKSLIALVDLYLLQKTNETPSSHSKRFRIVEEQFPDVYDILDRDFPFYQDSYNLIMSKELVEIIKNDVQTMAEKTKVELS